MEKQMTANSCCASQKFTDGPSLTELSFQPTCQCSHNSNLQEAILIAGLEKTAPSVPAPEVPAFWQLNTRRVDLSTGFPTARAHFATPDLTRLCRFII